MFRLTNILVVLAMVACMGIAGQVAYAGFPYNLSADFSTASQSGAWSYGYQNKQDGLWHQYTTSGVITDPVLNSGGVAAPANSVAYWFQVPPGTGVQNGYGCLYKNTTPNVVKLLSGNFTQYVGYTKIYVEPGMVLNYTPGATWQCAGAGVRWTAPSSGVVHISATFSMQVLQWSGQWYPDWPTPSFANDKPQSVSIVKNGATFQSATLDGFAGTTYTPNDIPDQGSGPCGPHGTLPAWTYASDVTVAAGDTFDFLSQASATGGNSFPVGLSITISQPVVLEGTVSGVVTTNRPGNAPVVGAVVQVLGASKQTTTGTDGSYSISVPPGTYQVQTSKLGFDTKTVSSVVVTSSHTTSLPISLDTSFIKGQVTMSAVAGKPIGGVQVATADGNYSSVTDSAGNYSLQVTSGSYKLLVTATNYLPQSANVSVGVSADFTQNFALANGWDFASDFLNSKNSNPYGPWSYGYSTGADFMVYASQGNGQTWERRWQGTSSVGATGAFYGNTDSVAHTANPTMSAYYLESGQVAAYALGSSGGADTTVVRFAVPYGGYFNVEAVFSGRSTTPTQSTVSVVSDTHGDLLPAASLSGFSGSSANGFTDSIGITPVVTYSGNVEAISGEMIDARVAGLTADGIDGWTGVTFRITPASDTAYVKGKITSSLPGNPAVSGATLTFIGTSLYTAITGRDGTYVVALKPGTYRVIVERSGYSTNDQSGLSFSTGVNTRDLQLTFGGTWDFANDFTTDSNPNGSWSYGRFGVPSGTFSLYTETAPNPVTLPVCSSWNVGKPGLGNDFGTWDQHASWIWKYNGDAPYTYSEWNPYPTGTDPRAFEPGMAGMGCEDTGLADIRWVAPYDLLGRMSLSISSQIIIANEAVGVTMIKNGSNMFSIGVNGFAGSSLNGFTDSIGPSPVATFDSAFPIKAGDVFDLRQTSVHYNPALLLGVKWQIATFTGGQTVTTLAQIKSAAVGTLVFMTTPKTLITSTFTKGLGDNSFYVEDDDRSSAMKLVGDPMSLPDLSCDPFTAATTYKVTFTGTVAQDANGVKYVQVQSFNDLTPATPLKALGMVGKSLTASGKLVKVWGKVLEMVANPDSSTSTYYPWLYWTINDGSQNVRIQMIGQQGWMNSGTIAGVGINHYIAVTGIARNDASGNLVVTPWVEYCFADFSAM